MALSTFLQQLKTSPETIEFNDVMSIINECYIYTRHHSKCGISVGVKSNLGKALNLENGCSIVQFNNAA